MPSTITPNLAAPRAAAAAVLARPMDSNKVTDVTLLGSQPREQNTVTISSPAIKIVQEQNRVTTNSNGLLSQHAPSNDESISRNDKALSGSDSVESAWRKFRDYFHKPTKTFNKVRSFFTLGLNIIGVAMNFAAVIVKGIPAIGPKIKDWLDKKSEWFSRYVVPVSFAWNSVEAAVSNRFIESLARLIPAVLFWILPFYNFNMATGMFSGINYLLHIIDAKHNGKTPADSPLENTKATFKKLGEIISDLAQGKLSTMDKLDLAAVLGMLGGSAGGLAFAGKDRDSWPARIFGFLRNLAGLTGDARFVANDDIHKRFAGGAMIFASIANIFMRWVGDDAARILNHLSIALDDFGLCWWANESKRRVDAENLVKAKAVAA